MRRDYKVLLTTLIVFTFVISGFLLLGTLDATHTEPFDCEPWFEKECSPKQEGQLPECCPNPRQSCPLKETGTGTPMSKGD